MVFNFSHALEKNSAHIFLLLYFSHFQWSSVILLLGSKVRAAGKLELKGHQWMEDVLSQLQQMKMSGWVWAGVRNNLTVCGMLEEISLSIYTGGWDLKQLAFRSAVYLLAVQLSAVEGLFTFPRHLTAFNSRVYQGLAYPLGGVPFFVSGSEYCQKSATCSTGTAVVL